MWCAWCWCAEQQALPPALGLHAHSSRPPALSHIEHFLSSSEHSEHSDTSALPLLCCLFARLALHSKPALGPLQLAGLAMERLRRVQRQLSPALAAADSPDTAAAAVLDDTVAELTPWSARVRELLAERCPQSAARNAEGYPLLGIDPGPRAHPTDPGRRPLPLHLGLRAAPPPHPTPATSPSG